MTNAESCVRMFREFPPDCRLVFIRGCSWLVWGMKSEIGFQFVP
jgi:hypothetical protein